MSDGPLATRTSAEVGLQPILVVPLGSTEQHGPHLPLATDTLIADALAGAIRPRLADALDREVLVAPAVPYGAAGEHQTFPGTLSIGHDALRMVLVELVRSAAHHHDAVVFVNGHGGNHPTVADAVTQLRREGHRVAVVGPTDPDGDAHAGRTETSLLLRLCPDLVHLERAEPGDTRPLGELLVEMQRGGVAAVSPNGVLGDPTGASAEHGERLLGEMVERATAIAVDHLSG